MKTKPRPSKMCAMTCKRGDVIHLGFEIGNGAKRFLCCSRLRQKRAFPKEIKSKVFTCEQCIHRYQIIQNQIKKLGVEWVCEGIWLPMEQRTFKDVFIGT